ncbi:MAG: anti-sigma factor family protein [Ktedonobacterales bacterium]
MSTRIMRCHEARPYLSAYVDGDLDSALRERVQKHLASCAACRQAVARYQALDAALGRLPAPGPSPEVLDRVLAATNSVNRERAVRQSLRRPEKPLAPRSLPAFILADTNLAAPLRVARKSGQLRHSGVMAWALPSLAALLVVVLAFVSFHGRPGQMVNPTPNVDIQSQVNLADRKVEGYYEAVKLPFLPLMPTTLPTGARFKSATVTSASGTKYLDVVWSLGAPFSDLHLREMPVPLNEMPGYSVSQPYTDLTWQVPNFPQWQAMSDSTSQSDVVVGQDMSLVYPPHFSVILDVGLPSGEVLNQSSPEFSGALADLRLTSLSIDIPYQPTGAIAAPASSLVVHYEVQMQAALSNGAFYQWDVYQDQPNDVAKATLYTSTSSGDRGTLLYTDYTYLHGTDVTRCNTHGCELVQPNSPLVDNAPFTLGSKVQTFLDNINAYVRDGELWNLGGVQSAPTALGIGSESVYALAYVSGPSPITIYVTSGADQQVVGVISQIGPNIASPGGANAQPPFFPLLPLGSCWASYPLIVYLPSSKLPASFSWEPSSQLQSNPVQISAANVPNVASCT